VPLVSSKFSRREGTSVTDILRQVLCHEISGNFSLQNRNQSSTPLRMPRSSPCSDYRRQSPPPLRQQLPDKDSSRLTPVTRAHVTGVCSACQKWRKTIRSTVARPFPILSSPSTHNKRRRPLLQHLHHDHYLLRMRPSRTRSDNGQLPLVPENPSPRMLRAGRCRKRSAHIFVEHLAHGLTSSALGTPRD
jgi:hypothetical protein